MQGHTDALTIHDRSQQFGFSITNLPTLQFLQRLKFEARTQPERTDEAASQGRDRAGGWSKPPQCHKPATLESRSTGNTHHSLLVAHPSVLCKEPAIGRSDGREGSATTLPRSYTGSKMAARAEPFDYLRILLDSSCRGITAPFIGE